LDKDLSEAGVLDFKDKIELIITFASGGLTENDFIMVQIIDEIVY